MYNVIGFNRNLLVLEIIGHVWSAAKIIGTSKVTGQRPITNVVIMSMSEPLLSWRQRFDRTKRTLRKRLNGEPIEVKASLIVGAGANVYPR